MIERDWTITDQADAADAEYDRNWWRRDSSLCPWPEDDCEDDEGSLSGGAEAIADCETDSNHPIQSRGKA